MTPPLSDGEHIDAFTRRQLADYVRGGRTVQAALAAIIEALPPDARTIIDLRCGIGWSTSEVGRARPGASIRGWDPHAPSVGVAARLFGGPRITFGTAAPERDAWRAFEVGIAIVTDPEELEEIEEIEAGSQGGLNEILSAGGQLLFAIPDAPVAAGLLASLAARLGARAEPLPASSGLVVYRIAGPETILTPRSVAAQPPKSIPAAQRRHHVLNRLGRSVTKDGYVIPKDGSVRVLIVSPNRARLSESFIKANIEGLPAHVDVLFGQPPALEDETGRQIVPQWAHGSGRMALALPSAITVRLEAYWLDRALAARKPAVVLAEYGPTGVALLDACRRRSIPLVTQFFGFDAAVHSVLEAHRDGYQQVLRYGRGVAVSRDIAQRLAHIAGSADRIHYVPCGVDPGVDRRRGSGEQ